MKQGPLCSLTGSICVGRGVCVWVPERKRDREEEPEEEKGPGGHGATNCIGAIGGQRMGGPPPAAASPRGYLSELA